jgi:hypothetical protein
MFTIPPIPIISTSVVAVNPNNHNSETDVTEWEIAEELGMSTGSKILQQQSLSTDAKARQQAIVRLIALEMLDNKTGSHQFLIDLIANLSLEKKEAIKQQLLDLPDEDGLADNAKTMLADVYQRAARLNDMSCFGSMDIIWTKLGFMPCDFSTFANAQDTTYELADFREWKRHEDALAKKWMQTKTLEAAEISPQGLSTRWKKLRPP